MKELNKRTPIVFYVSILLLAAVFFTMHLSGGLFARYQSNADGSDSARVAAYVFELTSPNESKELPVTYTADGSGIYPIEIKNTNGTRTCEVAQSYTVTVSNLTSNVELAFTIYTDEACTQAFTQGTLPAGVAETDTLYLKISLPANADYTLASEIDLIRLSVSSAQID